MTTKEDNKNDKPTTLAGKLAKIGEEIGKVDKGGYNSEQRFKFIEYAVVAGRIRTLFSEYGVIIKPEVLDYRMDEVSSKSGRVGYHYILHMRFSAINADNQEDKLESEWFSESIDYGDKGLNKAITSGTKYFIMRIFNISERDDEDNDASTPEAIAPRQAAPDQPRLSFEALRERVKTLTTDEAVDEAFHKTMDAYPSLTPRQIETISKIFNERKQAIADQASD